MAKFINLSISDKVNEDQTDSVPDFLLDNSICKSASVPVSSAPKKVSFNTTADRYHTFETWPLHHFIKPYDLAKAGFVYTGYSDKVQCIECKIILKQFELDDIPMLEHTRWSPKCPFVLKFFKDGSL